MIRNQLLKCKYMRNGIDKFKLTAEIMKHERHDPPTSSHLPPEKNMYMYNYS